MSNLPYLKNMYHLYRSSILLVMIFKDKADQWNYMLANMQPVTFQSVPINSNHNKLYLKYCDNSVVITMMMYIQLH